MFKNVFSPQHSKRGRDNFFEQVCTYMSVFVVKANLHYTITFIILI